MPSLPWMDSWSSHDGVGGFIFIFERVSTQVDKPPNVLRITVIRAKDLPAVDKKLFGKGPASADPFPVMSVEGNQEKGSVKKKCLAPVWLERFELPCEDPDSVFSFEVMDHDNFGAADFMGCCLCGIKFKRPSIRGLSCSERGAARSTRSRVSEGRCVRVWAENMAAVPR